MRSWLSLGPIGAKDARHSAVPVPSGEQISQVLAIHPVITTHPGTGKKVLFVNRLMTTEIIGLSRKESDSLLDKLFRIQEQEEFIYDHHWRPRDLIIWDNRSSLHARTDFDPKERRLLKRVTTQGEIPVT